MLKVFATDVVVSKGYDNAPALKFGEKGESVRFRIGKKVYDARAEGNNRWINISVKAFGTLSERIKKMKIKEGSLLNLIGRLDEDTWTDSGTGEVKKAPVIILDEVEYASGGGKKDQKRGSEAAPDDDTDAKAGSGPETSGNFTGFQSYSGGSFFDV